MLPEASQAPTTSIDVQAVDAVVRPGIAEIMRGNGSKDTRPELRLRRALHRRGLRYRIHRRPLPGVRRTADILFGPSRVAVFVDGCFWHGCPDHYRPTSHNVDFWSGKMLETRRRDQATNELLQAAGWLVVRVWEHEDADVAAGDIAAVVRSRRPSGSGRQAVVEAQRAQKERGLR